MDDAPRSLRPAFAGGGTGGHIAPGLHLLEAVCEREPGRIEDLLWFTSGRKVEDAVLDDLDARAPEVPVERCILRLEPRGGGAPRPAGLIARTPFAVGRARAALVRHRSDVLLGLGGFTMIPAVLAARSLGIPVALLEINAARGRAARRMAPFARVTLHAFPASLPPGGESARDRLVGPPLAPRLARLAREREHGSGLGAARRVELGFAPDRPLLVVLGGSQGAGGINAFLRAQDARLAAAGVQVLHQVGPGRLDEAAPARPGYRALEYLRPVEQALAAATGVLCRGGASTLAELAAVGAPAWVVPYPHHADRHQERNARSLGEGVRIVPERELDAARADELARFLAPNAEPERAAMSRCLVDALPRDAASRVFAALSELARVPRARQARESVS